MDWVNGSSHAAHRAALSHEVFADSKTLPFQHNAVLICQEYDTFY